MYFDDLTPYCYNLPKPLANVLNIGWLDECHPFSCGTPPAGFVDALRLWLLHANANQMRGFQLCRFCRFEGNQLERYQQIETMIEGQQVYLGSAEIWIPCCNGVIFAAPNLILHYVEVHKYLPPLQFIQAVMCPIPPNWNAGTVSEMMIAKAFD